MRLLEDGSTRSSSLLKHKTNLSKAAGVREIVFHIEGIHRSKVNVWREECGAMFNV